MMTNDDSQQQSNLDDMPSSSESSESSSEELMHDNTYNRLQARVNSIMDRLGNDSDDMERLKQRVHELRFAASQYGLCNDNDEDSSRGEDDDEETHNNNESSTREELTTHNNSFKETSPKKEQHVFRSPWVPPMKTTKKNEIPQIPQIRSKNTTPLQRHSLSYAYASKMRKRRETYTEPFDFEDWGLFDVEYDEREAEILLEKYHKTVGKHYAALVPHRVSRETFWLRYFYRCDPKRIQQEWDETEQQEKYNIEEESDEEEELQQDNNKKKNKRKTRLLKKLLNSPIKKNKKKIQNKKGISKRAPGLPWRRNQHQQDNSKPSDRDMIVDFFPDEMLVCGMKSNTGRHFWNKKQRNNSADDCDIVVDLDHIPDDDDDMMEEDIIKRLSLSSTEQDPAVSRQEEETRHWTRTLVAVAPQTSKIALTWSDNNTAQQEENNSGTIIEHETIARDDAIMQKLWARHRARCSAGANNKLRNAPTLEAANEGSIRFCAPESERIGL